MSMFRSSCRMSAPALDKTTDSTKPQSEWPPYSDSQRQHVNDRNYHGPMTIRTMKWSMGLGTISKVFDFPPRGTSNAGRVCTQPFVGVHHLHSEARAGNALIIDDLSMHALGYHNTSSPHRLVTKSQAAVLSASGQDSHSPPCGK